MGKCCIVLALKQGHCRARYNIEKHYKLCQIGKGNNPMVGMTVSVAVSIQEAAEQGKF